MNVGTHTCPNCQHISVMETTSGRYYTCGSCDQAFIEYDSKPDKPEEFVAKAETMSPILIGSKGRTESDSFTVKGCITLFQERTTVNLHSITFSTGKDGLIVECDGEYSVITIINEHPQQNLKETRVGKETDINVFGKAFCYSVDKTDCIALKGEGKWFFNRFTASLFCSFYSQNKNAAFCFFAKDCSALLLGKFYTFNELNLTPTRSINEWYK